jgi:nitroreductase
VTALLSRSTFLRRLYLGTGSSAYDRESRSVLSGLATNRNAKREQPSLRLNYYSLRRQIHRLEKGLIASPRRSVFAADYAPKVVDALAGAPEAWQQADPDLYAWALGVLTDYFNAIDYDNDPRLEAAQRKFAALTKTTPCDLDGRAPYPASERPPLTVEYDDLHQLFRRRRSVRWFESTPVPRELLDQALVAASQAPSACNRQPYRFVIADDPTDAQTLGGLAFGTVGFAQQFPCCIALVGELSAFSDLRDRHVIYIDGGLVAMSFVLACETLGLATCLINWPDLPEHDEPAREYLQLADHEQIIVLIAVGYAADEGGVPRSVKKDLRRIRVYRDGGS